MPEIDPAVARVRRIRRSAAKTAATPPSSAAVMYMALPTVGAPAHCRSATATAAIKGLPQMVYLWSVLSILSTVTNLVGNINNNQNNNNNNNKNVNLNIVTSSSNAISANTNNANAISILLPPPIPVLAGGRRLQIEEMLERAKREYGEEMGGIEEQSWMGGY